MGPSKAIAKARKKALKQAEGIARSHATCGCNGKHGACMVDDVANGIADEIAALLANQG
jgi:hypothetical protein